MFIGIVPGAVTSNLSIILRKMHMDWFSEIIDLENLYFVLNVLGVAAFLKLFSTRILSMDHYYILRNGFNGTNNCPIQSTRKMEIAPISESDISEIKNALSECNVEDKREILSRLIFYKSGLKNCYVIRHDKKIAHMQWIIYPEENELIKGKYRKKFYPLADSQVMIENAFTFPSYRGLGYISSATLQLMDLARSRGYRSAVCYIRKDKIASLNEFSKMGFRITKMVPEYKVLGKVWRAL
jgi:ribosomal protein S18 acetylase RimI-like enzyme